MGALESHDVSKMLGIFGLWRAMYCWRMVSLENIIVKVLITGWPRSGTMYVAEALARCGLRTTHEKVFKTGVGVVDPNQTDVEVSWLAVGHDLSEIQTNVSIVRLIRDPLKVLASNVANTPFAIQPPRNRAVFAAKRSFGDAQLCCCIAFMVEWWHRMRALPIRHIMNVERFNYSSAEQVMQYVSLDRIAVHTNDAWKFVPHNFNHLNPTLALSADDPRLRPMGPLLEEWEGMKDRQLIDCRACTGPTEGQQATRNSC